MRPAQYAQRMNQAFARAVSILGHPMLVLPLAALAVAITRGQGKSAAWMALGFALFAALVMSYSWWQVRRGRWAHVDASGTGERRSLNRFLVVALVVSAILAMRYGHDRQLGLGLGLSAAMIAVAMLTARWWKLSLHMAFVVFAATLLWSVAWWAGLAGFACAVAVAWSRLRLQRHLPRDLLAGATTGLLAGIAFLLASGMA
jgi:membrane-associated phospholipid phosphatase